MTFKSQIHQVCAEVATEFEGWTFLASGVFKNRMLKHTDLIVDPSLTFASVVASCSVGPRAAIDNKKVGKLYKLLFGTEYYWTFLINFRLESSEYYGPSCVRHIFQEESAFTDSSGTPQAWPDTWILLPQAKDYFRKMVVDGISFLEKYFDLTTEENLLRHLPTSYRWMDKGMSNEGQQGSFYEKKDGIMMCLAAMILGDFEFVEHYASDDFKTMYPKRPELQRILVALPDLKRKFAETGSVI